MVVDDLDVLRSNACPREANTILVVYPYAVLAVPIPLQGLEPIARRHTQVIKRSCDLKLPQLAPRDLLERSELRDTNSSRKRFSVFVFEQTIMCT